MTRPSRFNPILTIYGLYHRHVRECSETPGIDTFHRERSKCVDAFADLENAVRRLLEVGAIKTGSEPFGQKLGKLAKLEPSPKLSKATLAKVQGIVERCQDINAIRNDIVHSRLQLAVVEDDHKACFVNPVQGQIPGQAARLFTLKRLRDLSAEISGLAEEIRSLLT